jgi:hypothetical protein
MRRKKAPVLLNRKEATEKILAANKGKGVDL